MESCGSSVVTATTSAAQGFPNGGALMWLLRTCVQKSGIADRSRTGAGTGVKLFEHREQHHGEMTSHTATFENHPIVQGGLQILKH